MKNYSNNQKKLEDMRDRAKRDKETLKEIEYFNIKVALENPKVREYVNSYKKETSYSVLLAVDEQRQLLVFGYITIEQGEQMLAPNLNIYHYRDGELKPLSNRQFMKNKPEISEVYRQAQEWLKEEDWQQYIENIIK